MTTFLLTGGTGTFGRAFLEHVLPLGDTVRVFSRDEFKQQQLRQELMEYGNVRFFVGDVREADRVRQAADGVDAIIHAAALKQVVSCEYNPFEAVKTNVLGSQNVVDAALACNVPKSIFLSSDKAVHPVNVYGASKLCAEKVWLAANSYAGGRDVAFSAVRYGNVRGSRGSVLERWVRGPVSLTDPKATRFWMDPSEAVGLVLLALERMEGGEVFIPKVSSDTVANLIPHGANVTITGLQRGEKLHEQLVSDEEVSRCWDMGDCFVVADRAPGDALLVSKKFRFVSDAV